MWAKGIKKASPGDILQALLIKKLRTDHNHLVIDELAEFNFHRHPVS